MGLDKTFLKIFSGETDENDILSFERPRPETAPSETEESTIADELIYFDSFRADGETPHRPSEAFRAALTKRRAERSETNENRRTLPFVFAQDELEHLNRKNPNFSVPIYDPDNEPDDEYEDEYDDDIDGRIASELKIFDESEPLQQSDAATNHKEKIFRLEDEKPSESAVEEIETVPDEIKASASDEIAASAASDGASEPNEADGIDEPVEISGAPGNTAFYTALERSIVTRRIDGWPELCRRLHESGRDEFGTVANVAEERLLDGRRIIGFGGTGTAAGTSTLLLGLARELVGRGFSLLVIDADFQNPSIARLLGLSFEYGWERLANFPEEGPESGLVRVLVAEEGDGTSAGREKNGSESFHLLPLAEKNIAAAAAAGCKRAHLRRILELAGMFDLTLVDHGSFYTGAHREKISELLRFGDDGYFLVGDARTNDPATEREWISESARHRLPCFGIIENYTRTDTE